jgi:hypothetical protein
MKSSFSLLILREGRQELGEITKDAHRQDTLVSTCPRGASTWRKPTPGQWLPRGKGRDQDWSASKTFCLLGGSAFFSTVNVRVITYAMTFSLTPLKFLKEEKQTLLDTS